MLKKSIQNLKENRMSFKSMIKNLMVRELEIKIEKSNEFCYNVNQNKTKI